MATSEIVPHIETALKSLNITYLLSAGVFYCSVSSYLKGPLSSDGLNGESQFTAGGCDEETTDNGLNHSRANPQGESLRLINPDEVTRGSHLSLLL